MTRAIILSVLFVATLLPGARAVSSQYRNATQARVEKAYAVVMFANGTRTIVPLSSLSDEDRDFLTRLSTESPLAHGKSQVLVEKEVVPTKQTIVSATKTGTVEKVQLCSPNVPRDQIGATCMAYARVHWLDIAGYSVDVGKLYSIINSADPDEPWKNPAYHRALNDMVTKQKPRPVVHEFPPETLDPFEWARAELRLGRPILAAFPREIWQALPPGFVAQRPWSGGSVGHQIVVNGFTWDSSTRKGTFHIVNSWNELPEFDLSTEAAAGGNLVFEQSMSPRGEKQAEQPKEFVKSVTLVRAVGKVNMYEVETNLGRRKVAAASEQDARAMIENPE